jgi:hypothetical protein
MNSKLVLVSSAIFLASLGVSLSFFPTEIAALMANEPSKQVSWVLQLTGALYFAFAMVNWIAKGANIGGIYNRPVAIGNLAHFTIGALALIKGVTGQANVPPIFLGLAILYTFFAVLFGIIFFGKGLP